MTRRVASLIFLDLYWKFIALALLLAISFSSILIRFRYNTGIFLGIAFAFMLLFLSPSRRRISSWTINYSCFLLILFTIHQALFTYYFGDYNQTIFHHLLGSLLGTFSIMIVWKEHSASRLSQLGPFFIVVSTCYIVAEFAWFNTFNTTTTWFYSPWGEQHVSTYMDRSAGFLFRYWGIYGSHPGNSSIVLGTIGSVLDSRRKSIRNRLISLVPCVLSFSGQGMAMCIILLLSILRDTGKYRIQTKSTRVFSWVILAVTIVVFLFSFTPAITAKISFQYLDFLISFKKDQILSLVQEWNNDLFKFILGIPELEIFKILIKSPNFASSDWGLAYRFGFSGLIGIIAMFVEMSVIAVLIKRISKGISIEHILMLLLFLTHYSPLNVISSQATLIFILGIEYAIVRDQNNEAK